MSGVTFSESTRLKGDEKIRKIFKGKLDKALPINVNTVYQFMHRGLVSKVDPVRSGPEKDQHGTLYKLTAKGRKVATSKAPAPKKASPKKGSAKKTTAKKTKASANGKAKTNGLGGGKPESGRKVSPRGN